MPQNAPADRGAACRLPAPREPIRHPTNPGRFGARPARNGSTFSTSGVGPDLGQARNLLRRCLPASIFPRPPRRSPPAPAGDRPRRSSRQVPPGDLAPRIPRGRAPAPACPDIPRRSPKRATGTSAIAPGASLPAKPRVSWNFRAGNGVPGVYSCVQGARPRGGGVTPAGNGVPGVYSCVN